MVSKKVETKNNVMSACVENGEEDWNVMSGNADSSSAQTGYSWRPAVGDSYDVGRSRRQKFVKAAAKVRAHNRYVRSCVY